MVGFGPHSLNYIYIYIELEDFFGGFSHECLCGPPSCKHLFNICRTGILLFLLSTGSKCAIGPGDQSSGVVQAPKFRSKHCCTVGLPAKIPFWGAGTFTATEQGK